MPDRQNSTRFCLIICAALLLIAAACNPAPLPDATPTASQESDASPAVADSAKQLATVMLSPTPQATPVPPTATASPLPSRTFAPPPPVTPTATFTLNPGVFMGDPSFAGALPTFETNGLPNTQGLAPALVEVTLQAPTPPPAFITATQALPVGIVTTPGLPAGVVTGLLGDQAGIGEVPDTAFDCPTQPEDIFQNVYRSAEINAALGCPTGPTTTYTTAQQPFERGLMVWRETGDIFALANEAGAQWQRFYRVDDSWNDSMPQLDESLTPPRAGLQQPVRGFGLAWRANEVILDSLGWAVADEVGYPARWQEFARGLMFNDFDGLVYVLLYADQPVTRGQYLGPMG